MALSELEVARHMHTCEGVRRARRGPLVGRKNSTAIASANQRQHQSKECVKYKGPAQVPAIDGTHASDRLKSPVPSLVSRFGIYVHASLRDGV